MVREAVRLRPLSPIPGLCSKAKGWCRCMDPYNVQLLLQRTSGHKALSPASEQCIGLENWEVLSCLALDTVHEIP